MSTIPGLPTVRNANMLLVGRAGVGPVQLLDNDGASYAVTNAYKVTADFLASPDAAAALLSKDSSVGGEITILTDTTKIYIPLSDANVALLKGVGKLHTLRLKVVKISDASVVIVNNLYLIPLNQLQQWSLPI